MVSTESWTSPWSSPAHYGPDLLEQRLYRAGSTSVSREAARQYYSRTRSGASIRSQGLGLKDFARLPFARWITGWASGCEYCRSRCTPPSPFTGTTTTILPLCAREWQVLFGFYRVS
ncbi:MAG: hypothetical protein ACLRWQ_01105 [Flavonifractor plautii]